MTDTSTAVPPEAKSGPPSAPQDPSSRPGIGFSGRMLLMALLTLLLVELLLGLGTNVAYASLPGSSSGIFSQASSYPLAVAHIGVGYLLGVLALLLTVLVALKGERSQLAPSLLGLVGIGVAGGAGMQFVTSGGVDAWSDVMAVAWLFSMAMFVLLERSTRPRKATAA